MLLSLLFWALPQRKKRKDSTKGHRLLFIDILPQKRFYIRRTLRVIKISRLPKILIGWDPWIKKRVIYLSFIEGKGCWKKFTLLQKMPQYLLIYYKISFLTSHMWASTDWKWLFISMSKCKNIVFDTICIFDSDLFFHTRKL